MRVCIFAFSIIKIFAISVAYTQIQPFANCDFDKGGFALICIPSSTPIQNPDSINSFYIDDIQSLNTMKVEWNFDSATSNYSLGPYYKLILSFNRLPIKEFHLSINDRTIEYQSKIFDFKPELLFKHRKSMKQFNMFETVYSSIQEGRKEWNTLNENMGIIMLEKPDWIRFEGEFSFIYKCSHWSNDCIRNARKYLDYLQIKLQKIYPHEDFELEIYGGSDASLFVRIKCNESLYNSFNLYPIRENGWKPFSLKLKIYWKSIIDG